MPESQHALTNGHCSLQLGVWGALSPPVGSGHSPGGGPGAKAPEALKILQFTLAKNTPLWSIYTRLQFCEFC